MEACSVEWQSYGAWEEQRFPKAEGQAELGKVNPAEPCVGCQSQRAGRGVLHHSYHRGFTDLLGVNTAAVTF